MDFSIGIWGLGGLQSIGNGCGLQIDGFSAHIKPYTFIFNDFHYFVDFGIVFGALVLVPASPCKCPEAAGKDPEAAWGGF